MTDIVEEMEQDSGRMADAVDKLAFITYMVASYYEVCPHCLAIEMAETFVSQEDEPKHEQRPQ